MDNLEQRIAALEIELARKRILFEELLQLMMRQDSYLGRLEQLHEKLFASYTQLSMQVTSCTSVIARTLKLVLRLTGEKARSAEI
jgi:hypothetical protein